jgi:hypothetical protein
MAGMEEFLAIAFQLFFEVVIQILGSPGISWAGHSKWDRGCSVLAFHIGIGWLCGWISALIAPKLILPFAALRLANLLIAPLVAGAVSYGIAKLANAHGNNWSPTDHAFQGFGFAFFFGCARYAFGTH